MYCNKVTYGQTCLSIHKTRYPPETSSLICEHDILV